MVEQLLSSFKATCKDNDDKSVNVLPPARPLEPACYLLIFTDVKCKTQGYVNFMWQISGRYTILIGYLGQAQLI
jgi:hypothetical protein